MMRVIALMCEITAQEVCTELVHDFLPRAPVSCIFAAGPELEALVPEGWTVRRFRCTTAPVPSGR